MKIFWAERTSWPLQSSLHQFTNKLVKLVMVKLAKTDIAMLGITNTGL